MPISATRTLLSAALDGTLSNGDFRSDENFGFNVPVTVPGVADLLLDPRRTWEDREAYDKQSTKLVAMFVENFKQYMPHIDDDIQAVALK
jgi:phosphoenolpyruvate carboxykinase (ATP)